MNNSIGKKHTRSKRAYFMLAASALLYSVALMYPDLLIRFISFLVASFIFYLFAYLDGVRDGVNEINAQYEIAFRDLEKAIKVQELYPEPQAQVDKTKLN